MRSLTPRTVSAQARLQQRQSFTAHARLLAFVAAVALLAGLVATAG